MARKRMIDPGIWESEDFGRLTTLAKLVFIGLFSQADDEGRGRGNPQYIKNTLFPYDEEIGRNDIVSSLTEIAKHMSIQFYESKGNVYYNLTNWEKWQTINRPTASVLPVPPEEILNPPEQFNDSSLNPHEQFIDDSMNPHEQLTPNRKEKKRIEKKGKEEKESDPVSERGFSPAVEAKVREWLQYKTERRDSYKPTGLRNLLSEIANNIKKHGEVAVIELISHCMSCNWAGIIWDRLKNSKPTKQAVTSAKNYDESF